MEWFDVPFYEEDKLIYLLNKISAKKSEFKTTISNVIQSFTKFYEASTYLDTEAYSTPPQMSRGVCRSSIYVMNGVRGRGHGRGGGNFGGRGRGNNGGRGRGSGGGCGN